MQLGKSFFHYIASSLLSCTLPSLFHSKRTNENVKLYSNKIRSLIILARECVNQSALPTRISWFNYALKFVFDIINQFIQNPPPSNHLAPKNPHSQLTRATHHPFLRNLRLDRRLLMLLRQQRAPIELLVTRRDVEGGVPVEEVDRLQRHLDHLARHDGEVLDARHVL